MKNLSRSKWQAVTASMALVALLSACGGGGGGDLVINPTPTPVPPLKAWTGPSQFMLTQPETGTSTTKLLVASVDGAVDLDGTRRNFQAAAMPDGQLAFSAGQPWQEDASKISRSMQGINGKKLFTVDYPDDKSVSLIGGGLANQATAVRDFIALCTPGKRYFLVNADAQRVFADSLAQFKNQTLQAKNFTASQCSAALSVMQFDASGNVTLNTTQSGSQPEAISASQMLLLANGGHVLTADGIGKRSFMFYSLTDTAGTRMLIQEFVVYPNQQQNYIRIWY
ncbi:hypothetical protein [Deefgea sp. CFH1-16]|uniref:hypothetical protein n=1 Tax=Deefgea sp. CFH1-16 TaxID=2675457 RepID=UPI0015F4067A|nr:hypothetical protein [Deefgea sp. CFH1-16]MBM5573450.1 hypothetical protein [Deefgea sp. CFH1-16]